MALYEFRKEGLQAIPKTSMADLKIRERQDLQDVLRTQIASVDPDVLIISEEYSGWEDSRRRIDLLGLDRSGALVVFELKRTNDGGHMDLQAIRYASMVASLSFKDLVEIFEEFLSKQGKQDSAAQLILDHVEGDEDEVEALVAEQVRIVLVSQDFGTEITTAALWLNEQGLDIRCVRMQPYFIDGHILFDIQQLIPLPEAEDLMVRRRQKETSQRAARSRRGRDYTKYRVALDGDQSGELGKGRAILSLVQALNRIGVPPEAILETIAQPRRQRFWIVEGELESEDEFLEAASDASSLNNGKRFDPIRYFTADEELIRHQGRTYAFSTQWGSATEGKMARLVEEHGAGRVTVSKISD